MESDMGAQDLLSKAQADPECARLLCEAHQLFTQGCDDLRISTGLDYQPDFLAHALRVPDMAAQLCSAIDQSCRGLTDPDRKKQAKAAMDNLALAVLAMRGAVGHVAALHAAKAKAISAYNDNL